MKTSEWARYARDEAWLESQAGERAWCPAPRSGPQARHPRYFWRRVAALLAVAAVGAVLWSAGERLAAGASVSHPVMTGCPAGQVAVPAAAQGTDGITATCGTAYVARPGDTVWGVAVSASRGGDPRPMEDLLEAEIAGGVLQPGQVLVLPR